MEKHFNKKLVMTEEDDEHFENSTKCQICENVYSDGDVKVRYHCHNTGKYRGSADRDCDSSSTNKVIRSILNVLFIFFFLR